MKIFQINNFIKDIFTIKIVPCKNYDCYLNSENNMNSNINNDLEDLNFIDNMNNKKNKNFEDIKDCINLITEFLNNEEIEELNKTNKFLNKVIYQSEDLKLKIFKNKVSKIDILQSHIHKMGDSKTNPVRYLWNKIDFSIKEKAYINTDLLERCFTNELPRYNEKRIIFSLYKNGLLCQLPSHSGVIKTYSKNKYHKEYVFLVIFKLYDYFERFEIGDNKYEFDNLIKKDYRKLRFNNYYKDILIINNDKGSENITKEEI